MMTVEAIYEIPGRGTVAAVKLDADYPDVRKAWVGAWVHRTDGARWQIGGVEWYSVTTSPCKGARVGLLVRGATDVNVGDEVEVKNG